MLPLRPLALLLLSLALGLTASAQAPSYLLFESGPVRPLALSPDGSRLFVTNTPDAHLEIYDVGPYGLLTPAGSVAVGLEPVAVAARSDSEVWVVNHLSDSVSIVDVASTPPRVVRTLLVGDEPRDIVFAGDPLRAFISTAHRGQHREHDSIDTNPGAVPGAGDPQLTTAGIGRADVWVFEATNPGTALGGKPEEILTFLADTPRALATDGDTVYVAAHLSGNRSTAINELVVPDTFGSCTPGNPGNGVPGPDDNVDNVNAPETGIIVRFDGSDWLDSAGCTWNSAVPFDLPDHDVFAVDADTLSTTGQPVFDGVGTVLFNMTVNPVTGKVYVTNTEAPNHVDFEGPGVHGGTTVQGRLSESRVSVLTPSGAGVDPQHLNKHIDYTKRHTDPGADQAHHDLIEAQKPHSLATPLQVVVSDDLVEQKVYVAAFGSAKVGVFDASDLEDPNFEANFDPTTASADYIETGGGPAGLALSDDHHRLYVLTRFDQALEVYRVDGPPLRLQTLKLPSPEPDEVLEGRPILYDAVATSGNGEASCASCHIFGDFDGLAWNLGDPDASTSTNNQPGSSPFFQFGGLETTFHPMKGPMTTQTLRGLSTHGATHWRGDRLDGVFGTDVCDNSGPSNAPCDEEHSFLNFIVAFEGLIGHEGLISQSEMEAFTDFALRLTLPPNPVAELDNARTSAQNAGHAVYFSCGPGSAECSFPQQDMNATDAIEDCDGCHDLDPAAGFFGSAGEQSFENEPQNFKVAHLRNMYAKIGMFSVSGDQVRGFGFLHDGSVDTLFTFLDDGPFTTTTQQSRDLEQFMLAFPTDLAPVVGQQMSIGPGNPESCDPASTACDTCSGSDTCDDVKDRLVLLNAQAGASFDSFILGGTVTECDLVVKTVEGGVPKGYARQGGGTFLPDDGGGAIPESTLRGKAHPSNPGGAQDLQYLCTPPGSGTRMGVDRDEDSVLDGSDNCPAWPNGPGGGTCTAGDTALLASRCTTGAECGSGGVCSTSQLDDADSDGTGDACEPALLPEPGRGATLAWGAGLLGALAVRRRGGRSARRS